MEKDCLQSTYPAEDLYLEYFFKNFKNSTARKQPNLKNEERI